MSRIRSFVGIAAVAILVGTASLAQAQNWNVAPPGNWAHAAQPDQLFCRHGQRPPSSTMAERQTSVRRRQPGHRQRIYVGDSDGSGSVNMTAGISSPSVAPGSRSVGGRQWIFHPIRRNPLSLFCGQRHRLNALLSEPASIAWAIQGLGTYNMSGGSIGANAVYVGGGTGVFTQTAEPSAAMHMATAKQGHRYLRGRRPERERRPKLTGTEPTTSAGRPDRRWPRKIGGYGTGIFNQSGGTNAFIGDGNYESD